MQKHKWGSSSCPCTQAGCGVHDLSGGDTEGPVQQKTGPLLVASVSKQPTLLVPPHLSVHLKRLRQPGWISSVCQAAPATAVGLAALNKPRLLWKLKLQSQLLVMKWGIAMHELLLQEKLLG